MDRNELIKHDKYIRKDTLDALGVAILLFVLLNIMISPLLAMVFPDSIAAYDQSVKEMLADPVYAFVRVAIVAPITEEVVFRGLLLKWSLKKMNPWVAILLTSVLFGVLHLNLAQSISATAAGVILGLFYVRRESLGLNILTHSIYNGMVFVYSMITAGMIFS